MSIINTVEDHERFRAELASIAKDGRRKWVYVRQQKGRYYTARTLLSIVLVAFFVLSPFVKVGGHQFMLLNLLDRSFVLFGVPFWPQDMWLLVLVFLLCVVTVALFTATLGRIWCGWMCPQTIFMEMIFRRIEWFIDGGPKEQARRRGGPWTADRIWRAIVKQGVFAALSFVIANVFLAYLISSDTLLRYINDGPTAHIGVLIPLIIFSGVFYAVFARFREQACVIVCPYGRYMSALVDENTLAVTYDPVRGEPRGKGKDREGKGDCVDCYQCVTVCPTGIDIRNGIQLECVNCTACIDACDTVMDKVNKPRGLIRYASLNAIRNGHARWFTPRIAAYGGVWLVLVAVVTTLFMLRSDIEVTVLRQEGSVWITTTEGIGNYYRVEIINKTSNVRNITFDAPEPKGAIVKPLIDATNVKPWSELKGRLLVIVPSNSIQNGVGKVTIRAREGNTTVKSETTSFLTAQQGGTP